MATEPTPIRVSDLPLTRGPDRRQEHRRQEDRNLHYAREILCHIAGAHADKMLDEATSDDEAAVSLLALAEAVRTYRECSDAAVSALSVTTRRRERSP